MENMELYEKVREVPENAQKIIGGGRLKGFTDINPMWRYKALTENFGPCGIGWYYKITDHWTEVTETEVTANVMIELYIKIDGEWSQPITGVGGSKLVAQERNGLQVSDECYKMATTDAVSVACKCLGFGADIYWSQDSTKYTKAKAEDDEKTEKVGKQIINGTKVVVLKGKCEKEGVSVEKLCEVYKVKSLEMLTEEQFSNINNFWSKVVETCKQ